MALMWHVWIMLENILPALPVTLGCVLKWQLPGALLAPLVLVGHPRWAHLSLQRSSRAAPGVSSGLQCNVSELQAFLEQQQSTKPPQTTPDPNYRGRARFKLALGKPRQVY